MAVLAEIFSDMMAWLLGVSKQFIFKFSHSSIPFNVLSIPLILDCSEYFQILT